MVSLYRNPTGEGIFGVQDTTHAVNTVALLTQVGPEEVMEMRQKIIMLEETVKKFKVII